MDETLTDRIQALVAGRLDPTAADAVRAACAGDPEAAAFLAAYTEVHALTVGADPAAGAPRTVFAAVAPPVRRAGPALRWAAVAAGLGLLAAGAWWRARPAAPETVVLAALPVPGAAPAEAVPTPPAIPTIPATLVDYRPVEGTTIRWMDSVDEANAVAAVANRPVLIFFQHPQCPLCRELKRSTFTDPGVIATIGDFVPVGVDVTQADAATQRRAGEWLRTGRWPLIAALDAQGHTIAELPGVRSGASMEAGLRAALAAAPGSAARPGWAELNAAARRLEAGRAALAAAQWGAAQAAFTDAATAGGACATEATVALACIRAAAAEALAQASGAEAPDARLARAAGDFAGTPYADDFRRVRESLARTGVFPHLVANPVAK